MVTASAGADKRRKIVWGTLMLTIMGAVTEIGSALATLVINPHLDVKIRSTEAILQDQTLQIEELIRSNETGGRTIFDRDLGFRYRAGFRRGDDTINRQGLRATREYATVPEPGVTRVATFGDSFVYCTEVGNEGSWPAMIERAHDEIEILNYGVGAFGTAQAYLRFLSEGTQLSPDVFIIGFTPVMMSRTVSVYRRFLAPADAPLVKPRYLIDESGELRLLPNPLADVSDYQRYLDDPSAIVELGEHDHWYRPSIYENRLHDLSAAMRLATAVWIRLSNRYADPDRMTRGGVFNERSNAFRIQVALLDEFAREARETGAIVFIAIIPDRADMVNAAAGDDVVYQPLMRELAERGIEYVDLADAFVKAGAPDGIDTWFMPGGHYSAVANEIVAGALAEAIEAKTQRQP